MADAEAAEFPQVADELVGILEAAGRGLELAAAGRVTAQRQDVLDAPRAALGTDVVKHLSAAEDDPLDQYEQLDYDYDEE